MIIPGPDDQNRWNEKLPEMGNFCVLNSNLQPKFM